MPTHTQTEIRLEEPGRFATTNGELGELAPRSARVQVRRIGICGTDIHAFHGRQPFFEYPRILGHELGAEIVEVAGESDFQSGDIVAIEPYLNNPESPASRAGKSNCCEELQVLGVHSDGGMRPLIDVPIEKLHRARRATLDQLALVEMLGIGRHAVNRSNAGQSDKALILGAGPIGLSVLSFLQLHTNQVAVADLNEDRLAFCRDAFGVERTLTIRPGEPLEKELRDLFGGELPTLILDATGSSHSMRGTFDLIAHGGRIIFVGLFQGDVVFADPNFHRREITLLSSRNATSQEFTQVIAAIEKGQIDTNSWITHRMALTDVPEQFEGMITDSTLRKAVIEVDH